MDQPVSLAIIVKYQGQCDLVGITLRERGRSRIKIKCEHRYDATTLFKRVKHLIWFWLEFSDNLDAPTFRGL